MQGKPASSLDENEEQQEQSNKTEVDLDTSDEKIFQDGGVLLLGGVWLRGRNQSNIKNSFKNLANKNLSTPLLDLDDPNKLRTIAESHQMVGKKLKKGKETRDAAEFRSLRFKGKVTKTRHERVGHAIEVAKQVHGLVGKYENRIKTERTVAHFGLNEENANILRLNLEKWLANNKNDNPDTFLRDQARALYRQQCAQTNTKEDENKEKGLKDQLKGP